MYLFKHRLRNEPDREAAKQYFNNLLKEIVYYFFDYVERENEVPEQKILGKLWQEIVNNTSYLTKLHKNDTKKEYVEKSFEYIKFFYVKFKDNPGRIVAVNHPYKFKINGSVIQGVFPVIRETADGIEISSFNIDTTVKNKYYRERSFEYPLIKHAFHETFPNRECTIKHYDIFNEREDEIETDKADRLRAFKQVENIVDSIERSDFYYSTKHCRHCSYKKICKQWGKPGFTERISRR